MWSVDCKLTQYEKSFLGGEDIFITDCARVLFIHIPSDKESKRM